MAAVTAITVIVPAAVVGAEASTKLIARQSASAGGDPADSDSTVPSISPDGRYIAFVSNATNLSDDDLDATTDVYLRDTVAHTTELISRETDGTPADAGSQDTSVSRNGRFVAFSSGANNLSDEDVDGTLDNDIFVRDTAEDETTLVSRASGAAGAPQGRSAFDSSISANGRYVAFSTQAQNLVSPPEPDVEFDVFVRDLVADKTVLVSRRSGAGGAIGDKASTEPSMSAGGRYVAFESNAENFVTGVDQEFTNIYRRDLEKNKTLLASRANGANGAFTDEDSDTPSVSKDGRYVAFDSGADNISGADADDETTDVFVRDIEKNRTIHASRPSGGQAEPGEGSSFTSAISGNGRFVVFRSSDPGFVDPGAAQVVRRDLKQKVTSIVSRQNPEDGNLAGDDDSNSPAVSSDGSRIAFESLADNLLRFDDNGVENVFLRVLGG